MILELYTLERLILVLKKNCLKIFRKMPWLQILTYTWTRSAQQVWKMRRTGDNELEIILGNCFYSSYEYGLDGRNYFQEKNVGTAEPQF